jgi:ribonuclease HI
MNHLYFHADSDGTGGDVRRRHGNDILFINSIHIYRMEIDLPIDVIDILFSDIERLKRDLIELSHKYTHVPSVQTSSGHPSSPSPPSVHPSSSHPPVTYPQVDMPVPKYVYTDGSAINNGSPDAIGGSGVYFGENHPYNISAKLATSNGKHPTNQRAELNAINLALDVIVQKGLSDMTILSDSLYAINVLTKQWKAKDNLDLVEVGWNLIKRCKVNFQHVKAHTGNTDPHSIGNHHADRLANAAYR